MNLSAIHPRTVMGGAPARSRKRHGGFASLLSNFCHSRIDPNSEATSRLPCHPAESPYPQSCRLAQRHIRRSRKCQSLPAMKFMTDSALTPS